jgi:hypothetical protein
VLCHGGLKLLENAPTKSINIITFLSKLMDKEVALDDEGYSSWKEKTMSKYADTNDEDKN